MSSGGISSNIMLWAIIAGAIIVSAAALGWIVFNPDFLDDDDRDEDIAPLTVVGVDGSECVFYLDDLKRMNAVQGNSEFQNRFGNWRYYGLYKGVSFASLVEAVGGMVEGDTVLVNASDGYAQRFSYYNVYPSTKQWDTLQGDMILAYSLNGTEVPDWHDGYRLAFVPADEQYSNDDFNATTTGESRQPGSSAGSRWVKNVSRIVVERSWTVTIEGLRNETLNLNQLKQFSKVSGQGSFWHTGFQVEGPNNYTGVSLEQLLTSYVPPGVNYSVKVIGEDGYPQTLTRAQVEGQVMLYDEDENPIGYGNVTTTLAYEKNSVILDEDEGPFRLAFIGPNNPITQGHLWVKFVARLEVQSDLESWQLDLFGLSNTTLSRNDLESTSGCGTHRITYEIEVSGENRTYQGVALWILVAACDGNDPGPAHYHFNETLVAQGYTVRLIGPNGFVDFNASDVAGNNDIFLAIWCDGQSLSGDEFPLIITGPDVSPEKRLGGITQLWLLGI